MNAIPDWITADSHYLHRRICEYSARCTPAFPTPESIDQLMRDNWCALVKPNDTVLHLGDLGFFDSREHYPWLEGLPGRKMYVRGNHCSKLSPEWLAEHGFAEIASPSLSVDGVEILFTHYPQRNLKPNQANVHGHQHNGPSDNSLSHLNACVELWHYAPVSGQFLVDKLLWAHGVSKKPQKQRATPRTVQWRETKRKKRGA